MLKFTTLSFTCLYLLLHAHVLFAQCTSSGTSLATPYNSNTSNKGIMFDVTATNTITIFCFDANLPLLSLGSYAVFYKSGSYVGSENTPANWVNAGTSSSILSLGINSPTPIDVPLYVVIPAGQTFAFYIGATNPSTSTGFLTTTSSGYGTVASNANFTISGGIGITYPFGAVTNNRNPNVTIRFSPGIILPVEFTDFTAAKLNRSVLLQWSTESEKSNDYFEIERSPDGVEWNRIALTASVGESTSHTDYQEIDPNPLPGINYYRLSQYDTDGERTILKSISMNYDLETGKNELLVFPNPVLEKALVFGDQSELQQLVIFNAVGQDISKDLLIVPHDGYSEVNFENQQKGVYIIRSKTMSVKMVKE